MTAPDAGTPDPAMHATIAAAVERAFRDTQRVLLHEIAGEVADAVIAAATGRLLPSDARKLDDEDWAVRVTLTTGVTNIRREDDPFVTQESAQQMADYARRHPIVSAAEVVARDRWVGPWLPAPTDTEDTP